SLSGFVTSTASHEMLILGEAGFLIFSCVEARIGNSINIATPTVKDFIQSPLNPYVPNMELDGQLKASTIRCKHLVLETSYLLPVAFWFLVSDAFPTRPIPAERSPPYRLPTKLAPPARALHSPQTAPIAQTRRALGNRASIPPTPARL